MERIFITDGVWLTYLSTDQFMMNYLAVNSFHPLNDQTCADNSIAFKLLKRGSRTLPTRTMIQERAQDAYNASLTFGAISKKGDIQQITHRVVALDDSVLPKGTNVSEESLHLMTSILFDPLVENNGFREQYVNEQRKEIHDKLRSLESDKFYYAEKRCTEIMYHDERSGIDMLGSRDALNAVTPETALKSYRRTLSESPIEILYGGREDRDKIAQLFYDCFSPIRKNVLSFPETMITYKSPSVKEVHEKQKISQSHLVISFRLGSSEKDGERPVLLMLNEIFGHGTLSKLFMNVREKKSLCYAIYSKLGLMKGTMIVSCGIDSSRKEEAQKEIFHQLEEIQKGNITVLELEAARKSLKSDLRQINDSPASPLDWYLNRLLSGRVVTPDQEVQAIEKITTEDIALAAQKITPDTIYFLEGSSSSDVPVEEREADPDE